MNSDLTSMGGDELPAKFTSKKEERPEDPYTNNHMLAEDLMLNKAFIDQEIMLLGEI
jgi:hypothetical protein